MTTTFYAPIQIQDALLKMGLYINVLMQNNSQQRCEKTLHLTSQTFMKYMENEDFSKDCYEKVKALVHSKNNYYAFLLFDQMLKNNKFAFKAAKKDGQILFKGVWQKAWSEPQNEIKLQNLKLIAKVWGYIYGEKMEQNIKKWVEYTFKIKFVVSAEREAELKQLYSASEPQRNDYKIQQLLHNMDVLEQKPKQKTLNHQNQLQALLDQD